MRQGNSTQPRDRLVSQTRPKSPPLPWDLPGGWLLGELLRSARLSSSGTQTVAAGASWGWCKRVPVPSHFPTCEKYTSRVSVRITGEATPMSPLPTWAHLRQRWRVSGLFSLGCFLLSRGISRPPQDFTQPQKGHPRSVGGSTTPCVLQPMRDRSQQVNVSSSCGDSGARSPVCQGPSLVHTTLVFLSSLSTSSCVFPETTATQATLGLPALPSARFWGNPNCEVSYPTLLLFYYYYYYY